MQESPALAPEFTPVQIGIISPWPYCNTNIGNLYAYYIIIALQTYFVTISLPVSWGKGCNGQLAGGGYQFLKPMKITTAFTQGQPLSSNCWPTGTKKLKDKQTKNKENLYIV